MVVVDGGLSSVALLGCKETWTMNTKIQWHIG
jgi:hypothetical protein